MSHWICAKQIASGIIKNIIFYPFMLIIFSSSIFANSKNQEVNILSWWGYLDDQKVIDSVQKKCNVKISFDEYYENDEFLRRWNNDKLNYDLIIFSDTMYDVVKDEIKLKKSDLWKQARYYNPIIRKKYFSSHFPPNIVYFMHSLTGFLWNPEVVNLSANDSIYTIFKKASNKIVVMADDPIEENMLFAMALGGKSSGNNLNVEIFNKIVQSSNVYITNDQSDIYKEDTFAFSFSWSGVAINELIRSNENLKFLVHPALSHISTDFLAQENNKNYVSCVAQVLTSNNILKIIQNKTFYFSPYADSSSAVNTVYISIYKDFIKNLSHISWLTPPSNELYGELNMNWQLIKIKNKSNLEGR